MFRAIFSARREENGCGSRIGREKAHFLGVKWSGGRVRKTINDRFSERFARCRRSNAIQKRVEGERRGRIEVKGGGRTSHLLGPFPFAITISAPLSVPMGSIRFLSAPNLSICIRYIDRIRARGSSRKWRAPISFPTLQGFLPHRDISEETRTKSGEISCAYKNIRVYSG